MEDKLIDDIIDKYDFKNPRAELIRHNENMTFKVTDENNEYVLRIHKPIEGFTLKLLQGRVNPIEYLRGEMKILIFLNANLDIPFQMPIINKGGEYVTLLQDGTPVTLLKWVDGVTLENIEHTPKIMYSIGEMAAKLHLALKSMQSSCTQKFTRYAYEKSLLDKIAREFLIAENKGHISDDNMWCMFDALEEIKHRMHMLDFIPNIKSIVHSDFSPSNIIYSNGKIIPIDFSLSGYSYIFMDLGSLLAQFTKSEEQKNIVAGYENAYGRKINMHFVEPFYALQILMFIAFQHDKVYKCEWFESALKHWCDTIFKPLRKKEIFLM